MDLFEEVVKLRRAGKRGALATIVHTNGSIPSYESSRMLVREDGSIAGTIGGGCVEADVWAAAKEVMQKEAPRKMVFNLNNEASFKLRTILRGASFCITSFAAAHTSASTQPPPMVPAIEPSSRTSMRELS